MLMRYYPDDLGTQNSPSFSTYIVQRCAEVMLPDGVFYNPVQEFNRDLTIAVVNQFGKLHRREAILKMKDKMNETPDFPRGLKILEALAASGIRSVRMALEVSNVSSIIANDLSPEAVALIQKNVTHNNVGSIVSTVCGDAVDLMHQHRLLKERFDVVDIDPFGTASPFLNTAVQCLRNGGLLCVTSTDLAVLCGSTPGTSMGKYGGMAIKTGSTHEVGLRILLNGMQLAASQHGKVIEPLLSLSVDFYIRVFVRVWSSPISVKAIAAKHGICYICPGCLAYHIQPFGEAVNTSKVVTAAHGPPIGPQCIECGSKFHVFGPIWIGPLHSRTFLHEFLSDLGYPPKNVNNGTSSCLNGENHSSSTQLDTSTGSDKSKVHVSTHNLTNKNHGTFKRIIGMATVAYEELPDVPLYYITDQLASVFGCTIPKQPDLYSCLLNANYRVSCSHADKNSLKTDAPHSFVLDCFRSHCDRIKHKIERPDLESNDEGNSETEINVASKVSVRSRRRSRRKQHADGNLEISSDMEETNIESNSNVSHSQTVRIRLRTRPINPSVSFTRHPLAEPPSKNDGLVRYQINPEKYWGPKSKPRMKKTSP
uniref:tRNA (guanine(26)-N(2))-dimethyltransferase n=1 Tax=Schistosoma mansoni TaxID=6183 RepID=A0A5K4F6H5_SCHMA